MRANTSRAARAALAAGLLGLGALAIAVRAEPLSGSPCPDYGDAVAVRTRTHELWLCREGVPAAHFAVAIGRGGPGKHSQGDERTPLGVYDLGEPRPSTRYGTFIPILYPTPEQAALGFSGSDIGIHGPPRKISPADYPVVEVDWTMGCIATATDEEVGTIADFVRSRHLSVVIL